MPCGALQSCDVDYQARVSDLGSLLVHLAAEQAGPAVPVPPGIALEVSFALGRNSDSHELRRIAKPSTIPCPACGGVLSEMDDKDALRFRCQIGHGYTAECLDQEQEDSTHQALGIALRTLDARATLLERMAEDARDKGRALSASEFQARAKEYRTQAETVQQAMLNLPAGGVGGRRSI
jgi:two-component system chemotaxis response regulator CheB